MIAVRARRLRAIGRWLVTPLGAAVLALVLAADAMFTTELIGANTTLGRALGGSRHWLHREVFTVDVGGEHPVVINDESSSAEVAQLVSDTPERVVETAYYWGTRHEGLWMPAIRRQQGRLALMPYGGTEITPELQAQLRELVRVRLESDGRYEEAQRVMGGDYSRVRVVPWGIAHDLVALCAVVSIGFTLAIAPRRWRDRRQARAIAAGTCIGCGYDVRAIPIVHGVARCPECGRSIGNATVRERTG